MRTSTWRRTGLLAWIAILGVPDYYSGLEAPVSLLFAVATTLSAYFDGPRWALTSVFWAALVHLWANQHAGVNWLDDFFRFLLWLATAGLGLALRRSYDKIGANLRKAELEKSRLLAQLAKARAVQERLLETRFRKDSRLDLAWKHQVALTLGGDFIDLRRSRTGLQLIVADVSGKGPAAALLAAVLRGLVDEVGEQGRPGQLLQRLNQQLLDVLPEGMFVTCFAACWNLDSGELLYANAGHEPPLLFRLASKTTQALSCTGMPLGIEDQQNFPELSQIAQTGDILLAYTDGLSEARDERGQQLEEASIETELHRCQAFSAEEICARMLKLSPEFEHQGLRDDVLIVAARYLGSGAFMA